MIIKPDWNIFKVKFSGQEHSSFEWFCYLLFCKEFGHITGIPRYKNQAGIETNPINVNGDLVGWQAKFFNTKLSDHKKDFIESIDKTRKKHPKINRIIFYVNQDFGPGVKKNDPKYKKDIESHAKSNGIKIEWRTASFFESPFVCKDNKEIAQYFFTFKKSIFDFMSELSFHTKNLLHPIQSEIEYKDNKIKIDRSAILKSLTNSLTRSQAVILNGEAGSGKTAIIKDWCNQLEKNDKVAFFVFKATEFETEHINNLFKNYGQFTLENFIEEHKSIDKKYIIIDSSEKLSDLKNNEAFKEFLSAIISDNWKIVFTTRYSYLDDLKYQLSASYNINSCDFNVSKLKFEDLDELSKKYSFKLPKNQKFLELLQTPFFLREYLNNYSEIKKDSIDYSSFKKVVWNNTILKSSYQKNNIHIQREKCFLELIKKRVNENLFFVTVDGFNNEISKALEDDEIIKYNSKAGGYFIIHDIYEEWALDKIIERNFSNRENYTIFFDNIGSSLPIRRAFRNWLSEKLYLESAEIKLLIKESIQNNNIEKHWKDEILVSVLLSNYCKHFFNIFESELLNIFRQSTADNKPISHYEHGLLYKSLFLLRIACKEADESVFKTYRSSKINKNKKILETIFIKPKGQGWHCMIDFINKHKREIGLNYINFILPVIDEWNIYNKKGETTKNASQIALFYYNEITKENNPLRYSHSQFRKQIIRIMLNGSFEIKDELTKIFQFVISKKETNHGSKHYKLIKSILLFPMEHTEVIKNFPEQVLQLSNLFWTYQYKREKRTFRGIPLPDRKLTIESYFSIVDKYEFKYFPASPFNTPILPLLSFSYKQTVDFILSFMNKSIDSFARSIENQLGEVEVFIDEKNTVKQYANHELWTMYRGGGVYPNLLESIHMALERYFLQDCKNMSSDELEKRLLYLLKNTKSASISAVVTSICLAYPEKIFNVAKILFKTKQFILYDNKRWVIDQTPLNNPFNLTFNDSIMKDEMVEFNKLKHRKQSLESLSIHYQFFSTKGTSEKEIENRKQVLWKIFDNYYKKLPDRNNEKKGYIRWKFCLDKMDGRKMKPTFEKKDGNFLMHLNPEIAPDLEKYREKKLKKVNEDNKYISLRLWAEYKFKKVSKPEDYVKYENKPNLVIKETKEIIKKFKLDEIFKNFEKSIPLNRRSMLKDPSSEDIFYLFNDVPAYTCSVLIRDYFNELTKEDKNFCKEIIMNYVSLPFQDNYRYQITDGVDIAIKMLSFLLNLFPEDKNEIKKVLLLLFFIHIDKDLYKFSMTFILDKDMWNKNFEDAQSIFLGYLLLKQKFDDLSMKEYQLATKNLNYDYSKNKILDSFFKNHKKELEDIINNKLTYKQVSEAFDFEKNSLNILVTAFEMLPYKIENEDHKIYVQNIIPIFLKRLTVKNDPNHYSDVYGFLKKFSYFILSLEKKEIRFYLEPFFENFNNLRNQRYGEHFFEKFFLVEDDLNQYENFWVAWNFFYPKIVEICNNTSSYKFMDETIITNYLLCNPSVENIKNWHILKEREKRFFKKVSEDIGHHPLVLLCISKVLNDIGFNFRNEGIFWISDIIYKNPKLSQTELETNTIFYMENITRTYIFENRQIIKIELQKKKKILIILNFLIEKGSAIAYRLREDIL